MSGTKRIYITIFIGTFLMTMIGAVVQKADAICSQNYPYPGCTTYQMNHMEGGTHHRVKVHYAKARWGQSNHEWKGIPKSVNSTLARKYKRAVNRYISSHQSRGITGAAAYPKYLTWRQFKTNTGCFGYMSGLFSSWCAAQIGAQAVAWHKVDDVKRLGIRCGGEIVTGAAVGALGAAWTAVAVPPGAAIGAGGGAVTCVVGTIWDDLWN